MPDTEEWALYLTSHLLCWKAWCVIVGEGVGGGGPGMRKPGPLPQMSLEDNGKPDIKADRLQSCVRQQREDPFVLVRGSGRAPGGGGIGSKLFRHYKHERKCQALGQQRELLTQSRLVGVWGKEIGDVGRPSRTCRVFPLGLGAAVRHWGPRLGVRPGSSGSLLVYSAEPPLGIPANQRGSPPNAPVTRNLRACGQGGPG